MMGNLKRVLAVLMISVLLVMMAPGALARNIDYSRDGDAILLNWEPGAEENIPKAKVFEFQTNSYFKKPGTRYAGVYDSYGRALCSWSKECKANRLIYSSYRVNMSSLPDGKYSFRLWTNFTADTPDIYYFNLASTAPLTNAVVEAQAATFTGSPLTPNVEVVSAGCYLQKNVDYTVSYSNNIYPGKGKVTVTGIGLYTGTATGEFVIEPGNFKPITEIKLSESELFIQKGKSAELTATVLPADASCKTVTWTSSNTKVATVDANGKVTAKKNGEAIITATAGDGTSVKATATVTVAKKLPSKVKLDKKKATLKVGQKVKLTATVSPEKADNKKVIWTSSDTTVATVNAKGKVKAVGVGTAVITATTINGKTAECKITVKPLLVSAIEIKGKKSMAVGATQTLTAKVTPAKATDKTVVWTSNKTDVATVDENGVVTAIKKGTVKITATAADGSKVKAVFKIKIK